MIMKVKLLKPYDGHPIGAIVDVAKERANYLIRVGSAKEYKEVKEPKKKK